MAPEVLITLKPPLRPHKARSSVEGVRDMCVPPLVATAVIFGGNERFLEPGICEHVLFSVPEWGAILRSPEILNNHGW